MKSIELELQRTKLAQKKERLEQKGKLIAQKERKIQTKRLIAFGDLIVKAGLDKFEAVTLLGALLEIRDQSLNVKTEENWSEKGKNHLQLSRVMNPQPLIIQFHSEPSAETKVILREKKFKWNSFRQEWYGYGKLDELNEFLKLRNENAQVTQVDE